MNKDSERVLTTPDTIENTENQVEEAETPPTEVTATVIEETSQSNGSTGSASPPVEVMATVVEEVSAVPEEDTLLPKKQQRTWSFALPPSREQLWTIIAFGGVILLGAVLRFWDLGAKPLHWDESLHAYFSMQLLHNNIQNWSACLNLPLSSSGGCYRYDPLLHGPFQFHAIALVYLISQFLGAPDHGINPTTVRIAAALLGTVIVALPYFLHHYLGKMGAWIACFLLAVSPSLVYFSRFAREDIYMACFTLMLVVSVIQYVRTRKIRWAILSALSFVLSYATKEATFLSIAVFGSFAGALLVWEIASRPLANLQISPSSEQSAPNDASSQPAPLPPLSFVDKFLPRIVVLSLVLVYFVLIGIPAVLLLNWMKNVSVYTNASPANLRAAQAVVDNLKTGSLQIVPLLGIFLAVLVFFILWREQLPRNSSPERHGLARWVDPQKQRLLDTIVAMPWTHWFFALVIGWSVFLVLFTALFTYMPGIGDGIWQGIFYWITQQTVARAGEPWYYYFTLIPLYEQIGLIFGILGIINCLRHPTRLRLFLVYWFIGNFFIYTWAGEKMPWLVIHMTLPLMLLAALGLRPIVECLIRLVKDIPAQSATKPLLTPIVATCLGVFFMAILAGFLAAVFSDTVLALASGILAAILCVLLLAILIISYRTRASWSGGGAIFGAVTAILALVLTLQNMYQLTYPHPSDAKVEMLVYVQTTPYVDTVMNKIATLDQKYYGGKYEIPIGVTADATWPFSWYLRDYKNVGFNCNVDTCKNYPVIIGGDAQLADLYTNYSSQYNYHQYEMRAQGNQGYMPPPCVPTPGHPCEPQQYTGVGLGLWVSWGASPPKGASFDLGRAIMRVWQWWWLRIPIGRGVPSRGDQPWPDDQGAQMALFIQRNLHVAP